MTQYLLAIRYADREPSGEEFRRLCVDVPAFDAELEDAGAFVFHGGLLSPESATVVRQSGDDFLIIDGPGTDFCTCQVEPRSVSAHGGAGAR